MKHPQAAPPYPPTVRSSLGWIPISHILPAAPIPPVFLVFLTEQHVRKKVRTTNELTAFSILNCFVGLSNLDTFLIG